jgi:hypothetical protein
MKLVPSCDLTNAYSADYHLQLGAGYFRILRLSTGYPYKALSLSTKPEVPWYMYVRGVMLCP